MSIEQIIDIELEKVEYDPSDLEIEDMDREYSPPECENDDCEHSPKYHVIDTKGFAGEVYVMKSGTMSALINGWLICEGCIDQAFKYIKSKIDRKLWAFK